MKLNLGCGSEILEGYTNVDFEKFEGVDLVFDLNKFPYPFKNNEVDEVLMLNILEYLDNPFKVIKEIHRICKVGADIYIKVPHFSSFTAWADIEHKRGYSVQVFKNKNVTDLFEVKENKIIFNMWYFLIGDFFQLVQGFYERIFAYIFPASHIKIRLVNKSKYV